MWSTALFNTAVVLLAGASIAVSAAGTQAQSQEPSNDRGLIRRGPEPSNGHGLIKRGPSAHPEPKAPLLIFNMVALDAKGAPLEGLRDTDLRLYDDGKVMHPAFCRPLQTVSEAARLGPQEYSNRPIRGDSQTILILLDLLNENFTERGLGWNEVARAFQRLGSGDRVYIYLITEDGSLYPVRPMPSAGNLNTPADPDWAAKVPAMLDQAMRNVNSLRPQELQVNIDARIRKSLAVLKDLAADLAVQPSRKSLVWVSHGVPISARNSVDGMWRDYTKLIQGLGSDLARAGIMLYAVDQSDRATMGRESMDTLEQLSRLTGGVWLPSDETKKAIQQALLEGAATYRVGYTPPWERWDNKFHKLRIALTGKNSGVRLRIPEAYFGDAREADPRDRFAMAALGDTDASEIGIRAAASPNTKVPGLIHLQVRVDAADLQLTSGETSTGEIRVSFAYYTTEWQPDVSLGTLTQLHLSQTERDAVLRDGVDLSFNRSVPSGARKIRIVVTDNQSGAVGSLTVPVASPSQQ
jgi:VWFA-related protein